MGIVKTKTGWAIDYYRNGRRIQEYVGESKTLAAQALARVRAEAAQDRYFPDRPMGGDLLVSAVLDSYWNEHLQYRKSGPKYRYFYEAAKKAFGRFALKDLRKDEIERWMRATVGGPKKYEFKLEKHSRLKPATVNRTFQFLSAAIYHGIRTDSIRGLKNPCSLVRKLPENNVRDVVLSEAEFNSLYRCLAKHIKPVVLFAYYTGARRSEILNLEKKDVDFFGNTAFIRDSKNGESRYVPLAPELRETLVRLAQEHPGSPALFNHSDGSPVKTIDDGFRAAADRVGLANLHFHDIRHTCITNWHNAGHSHFLIMQASGHKTISCFKRYLSFRNQDLQKLVLRKDSDNLETGQTPAIANAM